MEMSHNHRNRGASFGHKDKRRARSRKNHRFAGPYDGHDRYLSQPQDGIYDDRYNDRPNGKHNGTHDPRYDAKHEPKQKDRYVDRYVDRYIDKSQDSNGNSNGSQGTSPRTPSTASSQLPSGPRALDSKEKKPKISGTNPITGVNDHDANFAKLQHHSDFETNLAFPHNVDHRKNYKVVDPFSKTKNIRFNGGDILQVSDPRLNNVLHYFQKPNKTSKKFPFKQLPQTRFQYDKDSLGPPPQTDLVVWDLPATTQEIYLCNYFKSFDGNDIKDIKFVNDPNYAVPLGIVSFRFHGNVEKAAKLAKKLVNTIRAERPKIDGVPLKIDLNDEHNMFLNSKIEIAREKLRISRKIREEEEKKLRREMEEKRKLEEKKKQQEKKRLVEKDQESSKDLYKFKPNTTLLSRRHNNKIVPGVLLPDDLKKYVKDRPYILIQDKYVPTKKITSLDIKRTLNKYDWTRVISDKVGFFVVFNSLKEAERCFINEDGRKFYEYRLFMELATPKGFEKEGNEEQDLFTSKSTKHDIIDEAANMLIKEFQSFLSKDIRERIIAPAVLDLLSHERYPQLVAELKAKEAAEKAAQASVKDSTQVKQEALSKLSKNKLNSLQQSLPSFKKKNDSTKKAKKSLVPMQHALNYDHDSEEEDEDESTSRSLTPVASSLKRGRASTVTSVEPEDEHEDKKQKTGLRKTFLYESSSDEEMEEEVEEEKVELKDENEEDSIEIDKEIPAEAEEIDYSKSDEKYQPTEIKPRPVYREPRLLPSDAFDLDVLQSVIKDNEDLEMARLVLSEMELEPSKFKKNIDYWAWKQKDLNSVSQEIVEDVELIGTLNEKLQNPTGSFRSEGYKKILEKDKIDYLPHRRKIHKPLKTVQHEDDEDDTDGKLNGSGNVTTNNTNSVPSSRVNRANNRRFAADITAQIGTETEVLSLNALTKRKKPVSFARSAIHNWGLYALEPIGAKEMIIEYVGEQIRQQVAEHREKSYLKTGIGSSYLFRIDENTVIDATKKGGIARFINHCCNPSCTAKIIKVEGTKRIVIYALRDIEANEELTYDYKFERETNDEERIPCLCGAPGCKGYLN